MPDVFTKTKRSQVMSRIRGRGNKETEVVLARLLRTNRISGWRRHVRLKVERRNISPETLTPSPSPIRWERVASDSPQRGEGVRVRPDFVFRKQMVAVFVDGCFWHGCPKHFNMPASNRAFWMKKLAANKTRDRLVNRSLRKNGWRVIRIWEHDLAKRGAACVRKIRNAVVILESA